MSRQELADAVNAYIFETTKRIYALDAHYVGRLERGARRWPNADYRAAFRAVLGVETDAELGFSCTYRGNDGSVPVCRDVPPGWLLVQPGTAVVVVSSDHPVLLALVDVRRGS